MDTTRTEMLISFKKLFESQRADILSTHGVIDEDLCLDKDDMADEADLTSVEMAASMKMRLKHREALFLRKIDESLSRIKDGTFGVCEACDEDIELRRLEARPTASLCVLCKEEQERTEQLHIDTCKPKSLGARLRLA